MGRHRRKRHTKAFCAPPSPGRRTAAHAAAASRADLAGSVRATISVGLMAASVAGIAGPIALASSGSLSAPLHPSTGAGRDAAASYTASPLASPPQPTRGRTPSADGGGAPRKKDRGGHGHRRPGGKTAHIHRDDLRRRGADNVQHWIKKAIKIMQAREIPVLRDDIDEIRTIIDKESSGNPKAINLWDSNAKAGHPSKGLMQTIDSTFKAYKLPGHDDIYHPVDNIIAGVRYTLSRYGGFTHHPGLKSMARGGGYVGY